MSIDITEPRGSNQDGYCAATVSGTGDRDDVRISLVTKQTTTIPGTAIPAFITRVVEGR